LAHEGRLEEAVETLQRLLDLNSNVVELKSIRWYQLIADDADLLCRVARQSEWLDRLFHPLLKVLRRNTQPIDRIALYHQVITLQPDRMEAIIGLGRTLREDGSADLSLVYLRRAAQLQPESEAVRFELARTLEAEKQYEEANIQLALARRLEFVNSGLYFYCR
jgi:tetratricopeptide (TPR) repeat protein